MQRHGSVVVSASQDSSGRELVVACGVASRTAAAMAIASAVSAIWAGLSLDPPLILGFAES
jgi:hypothetical protein